MNSEIFIYVVGIECKRRPSAVRDDCQLKLIPSEELVGKKSLILE